MSAPPADPRQPDAAQPVTTLELFFDLVFVFTITQLTHLLVHELSLLGVVQVLLIFGVSWWMYGGYVWLTNHLRPNSPARRLLLLLGMAAFLVQALAIPHAFGSDGVAFGLAYLAVVLVHGGLFRLATSAISRIVPFNVASALLVIAAGFARGAALEYWLWGTAMALQFATSYLGGISDFRIQPGHFVERHGLLMLVALGESVVAIGIGAADLPVDFGLVATAVLGLALAACLWWAYFVGENERAEHALVSAPPERRPRLALNGFFYAHIPMLLGVVLIAVGVTGAIGHAGEPLAPRLSAALAGGAALYLAGDVAFRTTLRMGSWLTRALVAVGALATIPLGRVSAALQLVALVVLFAAMFVVEGARS